MKKRARGLPAWLLLWLAGFLAPAQLFPAPSYHDKRDLLFYIDGRFARPVRTQADWEIRRAHILENMQEAMGMRPRRSPLPLDLQVLETQEFPKYRRQRIAFTSELLGGQPDRVPAYLFLPSRPKAGAKGPAMLCLHQTTRIGKAEPAGLGGKPDLHYAQDLAEEGYVTLAPDYPNFGDYTIDVYANGYASATMKGIVNHSRAVDLLQSLREVDPQRIGVIGHSLGGHNALFVAAFDSRIKVVVTSCGFNSFRKYEKGDLTGWSHKGYMPRILDVYRADALLMPFDFTEVLAALAPRAVFIAAPLGDTNFEVSGVQDCIEAALPVYDKIFQARKRLHWQHPNVGHEFPPELRKAAYAFVDRWLKGR
jgi:dienelactone hydrolase